MHKPLPVVLLCTAFIGCGEASDSDVSPDFALAPAGLVTQDELVRGANGRDELKEFLKLHPRARALIENLQEGDLIFVSGHNAVSHLTNSRWVHVGMVSYKGDLAAGIPPLIVEAEQNPVRYVRDLYNQSYYPWYGDYYKVPGGVLESSMSDFLQRYLGDGATLGDPTNTFRVVRPAPASFDDCPPDADICMVVNPKNTIAVNKAYEHWRKRYDWTFGTFGDNDRFYCSELVHRAYKDAGVTLRTINPGEKYRHFQMIARLLKNLGADEWFIDQTIVRYLRELTTKTRSKEALVTWLRDDLIRNVFPRIAKVQRVMEVHERVGEISSEILDATLRRAVGLPRGDYDYLGWASWFGTEYYYLSFFSLMPIINSPNWWIVPWNPPTAYQPPQPYQPDWLYQADKMKYDTWWWWSAGGGDYYWNKWQPALKAEAQARFQALSSAFEEAQKIDPNAPNIVAPGDIADAYGPGSAGFVRDVTLNVNGTP